MKKRIENYIPRAIETADVILAKNSAIPKQYNGYISSFGASVVQSGLIPAVAFFSNSDNTEKDRAKILKALYFIAIKPDKNIDPDIIGDDELLKHIIGKGGGTGAEKKRSEDKLLAKILDAAVALKLAVRTFKLTDKDS